MVSTEGDEVLISRVSVGNLLRVVGADELVLLPGAEQGRDVAGGGKVNRAKLVEVEAGAALDRGGDETESTPHHEGGEVGDSLEAGARVGDELKSDLLEGGEGRVEHHARKRGVSRAVHHRAARSHRAAPESDGAALFAPYVIDGRRHVITLEPAKGDVVSFALPATGEIESKEHGALSQHRCEDGERLCAARCISVHVDDAWCSWLKLLLSPDGAH
mmetsp:Transcript_22353/g.48241  ORF Transcript_22353/g.48241 Transcript_22353/m.48241 type:complete len:217 (-) Transcript_22353:256-906(-)